MKARSEIIIDADRDTVWREFDNADNLPRWQSTLKSFTHVSGIPGEPGAVSEIIYKENNREIALTETMTEKRKPAFMAGIYESAWSKAVVVNHFQQIGDNRTLWIVYSNHNFKGLMKFIWIFFRKAIRERTETSMEHFKLLVESRRAERGQ
jgi:uncharacterized protein YndB with AHSA1/START domain